MAIQKTATNSPTTYSADTIATYDLNTSIRARRGSQVNFAPIFSTTHATTTMTGETAGTGGGAGGAVAAMDTGLYKRWLIVAGIAALALWYFKRKA